MKKEANFQTQFSKYNSIKKMLGNFELKVATGKSFNYSNFEPQQIPSLLAAQEDGYRHKYSDADPRQKPFDYSSNPPLTGYVVIKYSKTFYIISVNNFIYHRDKSKRKSITEIEARKISTVEVIL